MEAVRWSGPQDSAELQHYLWYEIQRALSARQPLEQQWRKWLEQYAAPASQAVRDFPWVGASNVVMPVTATDVDQYYAKFMQSIHADPDLWVVMAMNPDWQSAAKPLQDFLSALDRTILKMYRVNKRAVLEMVKLGTCIYEHGWLYEKRPLNTYDENGKVIQVDKITSRPFVDHIRLVDFLIPPDYYAIDPDEQFGAPWVAKRLSLTKEQLLQAATSTAPALPEIGLAAALKVIAFERMQQQQYDEKVQQIQYQPHAAAHRDLNFDRSSEPADGTIGGGVGAWRRKIELWEVHVRWSHGQNDPTTGVASPKAASPSDLVVLFHVPTQSIIRANYNPYLHGKRPFEVARFFPTEGFYGIGVCSQDEVFQKLESEFFNDLSNNVTIGNAPMMGAKAGANIAAGEPIFPGRFLVTDGNPREELFPMQFGAGAYPGLDGIIGMVQQQRVRRNGVGDLQLGNIGGLPGRTPATSVQALLAEGNKRPDLTLKDMRYEGLSVIGLRLIQLCQQYIGSPVDLDGKKYLQMALDTLGPLEGQHAVAKLKTPLQNAELGLGVEISAASATANKDMERQQLTGVLTLSTQLYPQMIQMVQAATQGAGTPVGDVALKAFNAMVNLTERVYEQYDLHDAEELVPAPLGPMAPPAPAPPPGAPGPQPGGPAGPGGPQPAPGVATLPLGTTDIIKSESLGGV
jgi:hypothetical protein